jgi:hypothetical protein
MNNSELYRVKYVPASMAIARLGERPACTKGTNSASNVTVVRKDALTTWQGDNTAVIKDAHNGPTSSVVLVGSSVGLGKPEEGIPRMRCTVPTTSQ